MNQISHYREEEVQDAMAVVAKWMGKDNNLRVNYHSGSAVSADIFKGIINIPRLACSSGLTDEALTLLRGRVYHEAGHISDTKLDKSEYPKGILFEILNAIEDRRMERVVANNYPGAKIVFSENAHYYNKKIALDVAEGKVNAPLWEALVAMSFQSECVPPQWRLSEKAQAYFDAGYDTFVKWKGLKDARGSLELAIELFDILKQAHEEYKEQQQQNGEGEESDEQEEGESGEGQSGEGEGQEGEGEAQTGNPSDFDDEEKEKPSKAQKGEEGEGEEDEEESASSNGQEGDSESESDSSGSEDDEEMDADTSGDQAAPESQENGSEGEYDTNYDAPEGEGDDDAEKEAQSESEMEEELEGKKLDEYQDEDIEKAFEELDPADAEYLSRRDLDEHILIKGNDIDKQTYKRDREAVAVAVASMVRALEQAMRARTRCRKLPYERTGKIDMTRLPQIAKNLSKEVFYRTRQGEKLETAVEIIIDESGSMSGRECIDVRRVAIAVGDALNQLSIPFEITGSTTKYGGSDRNIPPMNGLSRTNPIIYDHFKTFGQQWPAVCHNMSKSRAHMHNVDGEVVEYASRRLLGRHEARKIVLVLSDGMPDAGQGNGSVMGKNIIRTSERARKAGVEVYAFGIGTDAPKRFYGDDNFIHLPCGEDLGPKFAAEVSRIISGGRFKV